MWSQGTYKLLSFSNLFAFICLHFHSYYSFVWLGCWPYTQPNLLVFPYNILGEAVWLFFRSGLWSIPRQWCGSMQIYFKFTNISTVKPSHIFILQVLSRCNYFSNYPTHVQSKSSDTCKVTVYPPIILTIKLTNPTQSNLYVKKQLYKVVTQLINHTYKFSPPEEWLLR